MSEPSPSPPTPPTPPSPAPPAAQTRLDVASAASVLGRIQDEIGRAVVAQKDVVEQVLVAFLTGGHVLIEGVPGLGKTLIALALSRTFKGAFGRVQFTPDLMPTDVTGHAVFDAKSGGFRVRKGPVFTNLLLADEINRAPAKTQAALLEVMQERQISIEGQAFAVPRPFMVLATQNPIEQEGTYPLPEAQLDRFLFKVRIDYPPQEDEVALVRKVTTDKVGDDLSVELVRTVAEPQTIVALQETAARVLVDERIADYAVRVVRATRTWQGLRVGAGPRGAIALIRAARGVALLAGRDFVVPDDVQRVALPALGHRILLNPELEIEGQRPEHIIPAILATVETPRT